MTNPPTAADLIDRAVPCIEYLVSQGCPGLPPYVDIERPGDYCITDLSDDPTIYADNDPAVLDSIVVWVNGTVASWYETSFYSDCYGVTQVKGRWDWSFDNGTLGYVAADEWVSTYHEATIALLEAITEAVKGGRA